jgi:hypothetical protein
MQKECFYKKSGAGIPEFLYRFFISIGAALAVYNISNYIINNPKNWKKDCFI